MGLYRISSTLHHLFNTNSHNATPCVISKDSGIQGRTIVKTGVNSLESCTFSLVNAEYVFIDLQIAILEEQLAERSSIVESFVSIKILSSPSQMSRSVQIMIKLLYCLLQNDFFMEKVLFPNIPCKNVVFLPKMKKK